MIESVVLINNPGRAVGRFWRSRPLAQPQLTHVRLVSRNGNRFASFTDLCASLELFLRAKHAVPDGEIACLDDNGHSQFNELLFRRGTPRFCAFDLLWLNGRDAGWSSRFRTLCTGLGASRDRRVTRGIWRDTPAVSTWIPSEPLKPGDLATDVLPLRSYLPANAKDDCGPWYPQPMPEPLAGALH